MIKKTVGWLIVVIVFAAAIFLLREPEVLPARSIEVGGAVPGVLVAVDGRMMSPALRRYPGARPPLNIKGRWALPDNILAGIPGGHYLELRSADVQNSPLPQTVIPSLALPAWRLVFSEPSPVPTWSRWLTNVRTALGRSATGQAIAVNYLAGPRGTTDAQVRWDGHLLAQINTRQETWASKSVELRMPKDARRVHVMELANADKRPFDAKQLPSAFFITGVSVPGTLSEAGSTVTIADAEGMPMLLPAVSDGAPVRLWTMGTANGSNAEFVPVGEPAATDQLVPSKALADGYDAGLMRVRVSIERNSNGSQVENFRNAVSSVIPKMEAKLNSAISFAMEFASPLQGKATLLGLGEAKGKWHLDINGKTMALPAQPKGGILVKDIPVAKGRNVLTIVPDTGKVSWDWLGFDLENSGIRQEGRLTAARSMAPPGPQPMDNPPIVVDPTTALQVSGQSSIHPEVFGITDHNGLDSLTGEGGLLPAVRAMNVGSIKGADGILQSTAPKQEISADKLEAYYQSGQPLKQWRSWYWNLGDLKVIEATRAFGATRIVIGSALPSWSKLSASDWNVPPKDLEVESQMVVGGIRSVREVWPELAYLYVWNEPDAGWWRFNDEIKKGKGMSYGEYFQAYVANLRKAFTESNTPIKMGAPSTLDLPVSSAAGESLLDRWTVWWDPLVRNHWNDLDFFDFHFYGKDPREVLANLDVLAAMGDTLHGERKPVSITEANYAEAVYSSFALQSEPDCWRYRSLPYARFLISMAGQPDRIWATMCHDLLANEYGMFFYGGLEPTSIVDVFRTLAPLRGTLLGTSATNPNCVWTASRSEKELLVAIATSERNGGPIPIQLPENFTGAVDIEQVCLNGGLSDVVTSRTKAELINGKIVIPSMPGSLILVKYKLPEDCHVERFSVRKDIYSATLIQVLDHRNPSLSCKISCPAEDLKNRCSLRVSSFGPALPGDFDFFWNGEPIAVGGRYVDEVPLPQGSVREENEFLIKAKDPSRKKPFIFGAVSLISQSIANKPE
ncbi:MAG: hypothetical protein ACOYM3_19365 [Terrimicrobiaceae bacterium]